MSLLQSDRITAKFGVYDFIVSTKLQRWDIQTNKTLRKQLVISTIFSTLKILGMYPKKTQTRESDIARLAAAAVATALLLAVAQELVQLLGHVELLSGCILQNAQTRNVSARVHSQPTTNTGATKTK